MRSDDRRPPRKPAATDRDPFGAAERKAADQKQAAAKAFQQRAAGKAGGGRPAPKSRRVADTGDNGGSDGGDNEGAQRLQKVLAGAGIGSRRACEELIAAGRVTVDGRRAELGDRADPVTSVIHIDGERVVIDARLVYLALNKPRGIVSTMSDEKGRDGINELLGTSVSQRVFHVGRLDTDSEGLLLLTNDGDLAHRLTHPSHGVQKTYLCEVPGPLPRTVGRALLRGIELDDGPAKADAFRLVDSHARTALVEITLHEGRKHIVRRMLAEVGHPVIRLIRTAVGPVKLGDLKAGRWRHLSRDEVALLFAAGEAFRDSAGDADEIE